MVGELAAIKTGLGGLKSFFSGISGWTKTSRGQEKERLKDAGWTDWTTPGMFWNAFKDATKLDFGRGEDSYFHTHPKAPGWVAAQIGRTTDEEWQRALGPRWGLVRPKDAKDADWIMLCINDGGVCLPVATFENATDLPAGQDLAGLLEGAKVNAQGQGSVAPIPFGAGPAYQGAYGVNPDGPMVRVAKAFGFYPSPFRANEPQFNSLYKFGA